MLKHPVSHYFCHNIWITTSGCGHEPAIKYGMEVIGPECVLHAMDYPYQQSSDEMAVSDRLGISGTQKKILMQTNAEAVFRIQARFTW